MILQTPDEVAPDVAAEFAKTTSAANDALIDPW